MKRNCGTCGARLNHGMCPAGHQEEKKKKEEKGPRYCNICYLPMKHYRNPSRWVCLNASRHPRIQSQARQGKKKK